MSKGENFGTASKYIAIEHFHRATRSTLLQESFRRFAGVMRMSFTLTITTHFLSSSLRWE